MAAQPVGAEKRCQGHQGEAETDDDDDDKGDERRQRHPNK